MRTSCRLGWKRRFHAAGLLLVCVLLSFGGRAEAQGAAWELVPVPIREAEDQITREMTRRGFEVTRTVRPDGTVLLTGKNDGTTRTVSLRPRSALATEILTEGGGSGSKVSGFEADRKEGRDAAPPPSERSPPDAFFGSQGIPSRVLARIEVSVCVETVNAGGRIQFSGTLLEPGNRVLSTAHDLGTATRFTVTLFDGRTVEAALGRADPRSDLALLRLARGADAGIGKEDFRNLLGVGEMVYSVSCPLGLVGTAHPGMVHGPPRRAGEQPFWQVNMEILPGSSGGPVFDSEGRFVGIIKGRYRGTATLGFVIPVETVRAFLR